MSPPHRDYFFYNRIILRFAGLWRPENATPLQKLLYNTYATLTFLFVNVFFTATEFVSLYETRHDLYALIKNINFALTHLMGAVKCCFWFFRHGRLLKIMETLESEEDFLYGDVAGKFSQKAIMEGYMLKGVVFTGVFFALAHLTLTSSYVPPLIATAKYNGSGSFEQKLPYYSWMPFNYGTRGWFLVAMGYQAVPMFSYAYSIVGMDTLFMNLMNFIVAHLVVVQGAFNTIRERCEKKVDGKNLREIDRVMMDEMKVCVRHLQTIFRVRDELESAHKYLTLGQVTATLFILCTSLFLVSTTKNAKQLAAEVVYMMAMCFQLVLYCWFGNEVTREANEIPMSLWQAQWIGASMEFRKSMIFTMLRMRRPLVLTAGKFVPLTLTTFVAIIKASYSCFAVIKNTRE